MEECVRQGYAKSLGLSNFNQSQMERILSIAEFKPVAHQVIFIFILKFYLVGNFERNDFDAHLTKSELFM